MVVLPAPLQRSVAPIPDGIPVGAVADSPHLVIRPVATLVAPGRCSSSSCFGANAASFLPMVVLLVPRCVWERLLGYDHARRPHFSPLIPVLD